MTKGQAKADASAWGESPTHFHRSACCPTHFHRSARCPPENMNMNVNMNMNMNMILQTTSTVACITSSVGRFGASARPSDSR